MARRRRRLSPVLAAQVEVAAGPRGGRAAALGSCHGALSVSRDGGWAGARSWPVPARLLRRRAGRWRAGAAPRMNLPLLRSA